MEAWAEVCRNAGDIGEEFTREIVSALTLVLNSENADCSSESIAAALEFIMTNKKDSTSTVPTVPAVVYEPDVAESFMNHLSLFI